MWLSRFRPALPLLLLPTAAAAETNFKTQVEADIQPFRGILLGLFFVTTGSSLDVGLLVQQWPLVITLLVGLLGLKVAIISALGPLFGLSRQESVRTGFVLSQVRGPAGVRGAGGGHG